MACPNERFLRSRSDPTGGGRMLSLDTKLKILERLSKGEGTASIARSFGLKESIIRSARKHGLRIRHTSQGPSSAPTNRRRRIKGPHLHRIERELACWIEKQNRLQISIDVTAVREKAVALHRKLQEETCSLSVLQEKFVASPGWFEKFKIRQQVHVTKTGSVIKLPSDEDKKFDRSSSSLLKESYSCSDLENDGDDFLEIKHEPLEIYISEDESEKNISGTSYHDVMYDISQDNTLGPVIMTCEGAYQSQIMFPGNTRAESYLMQLQQVVQEGGYTPDQVFYASKTGLFWKRLPSNTFISKVEMSSPGYKARNDRFTLLLCTNMSGNLRLKPLLVYHTVKPRDLNVTSYQMLPVHWRFDRKASMTTMLFEDWFVNCAIPEVSAYCKMKNLEEKALILVDSVINQPELVNEFHPNIKVMFLQSNISSLLQPVDQGVIAQFKRIYTKSLLQKLMFFTEGRDEELVESFWSNYSMKEALFNIRDSWMSVEIPVFNEIWRSVCPHSIHDFVGFPNITREIQEIIELANKIPGRGFAEITEDDIMEHLESHMEELTAEEVAEQVKASQEDDDDQEITAASSMLTSSELKQVIKVLYETEQVLIEKERNPFRLEHSLPHLKSLKAIYIDALKKTEKRQSGTSYCKA
ncbi:tigger transposable element-derived protein 1 [Penaeus vannamei]|uniref:tigger transposable element-derived protein 1 n=1 Tax=Penaeus vannamei TaxID=6689 RepID=UPI00387F6FDB